MSTTATGTKDRSSAGTGAGDTAAGSPAADGAAPSTHRGNGASAPEPDAERVDITIIGAGPTGLFGAFYAGMRGASCRLIDTLPELGGQLKALYPEKYVYDVAGFPKVRAKELSERLEEQALQFDPEIVLDQRAQRLIRRDDHFLVETDGGLWPTDTVIIAAGKGAFEPRRLDAPGFERFWKQGVWPHVHDVEAFRDRRVLLVGGGDSAFDWSLGLHDVASELVHIHRSDRFRAHEHTVEAVQEVAAAGKIELLTFHEVREIHGTEEVEGATIFDNRSDEDRHVEVDAILSLIGFKPDLGPLQEWGLELEKRSIVVDSTMQTNLPAIFAAGDVATYEGKLDLLATGFGEVAIAVNHAVRIADPDARINPGHSTSMAVFNG